MAGLLLISTIIAGGVANKYHQDLNRANKSITELSDLLNQKDARIEQLGNLSAINLTMTMTINTKNILSISNQANQNAIREIVQVSRKEMLDSLAVWESRKVKP